MRALLSGPLCSILLVTYSIPRRGIRSDFMDFKTFLQLPFRKKLEHIWEYYRWQILVTVVVVSFLGSWIFSAVTHKDPVLELEMINAYEQTPDGEAFQEFLEQNGIE